MTFRLALSYKDSLDMTLNDHELIARTAGSMAESRDGVVIVQGTDRLTDTGDRIVAELKEPRVPIVLTGAMRPYVMRSTDAVQNLRPGVYVVMHDKVLRFPGIVKDKQRGTFTKADST